ncbi:hypothetical protein P3342_013584 [Pyrenophora teres f. teres]|nr:hypothetical protein PTNB85_10200 [Pyrenophora teres f. teres]KAE8834264.1 hypothetical protein HRS9122_08344 [Pyrenophora teres f. teres]KAE8854689.1 hypothetical protein PTNB73_10338 [Pyrenophora teres f. teres]KAK1908264.1 hypothetical protein P3342_013584 [Pyrenophora teres f. teres]
MHPNTTTSKIELGMLRDGYPALSDWISRDPDDEALVFRKFGRLAARNILHLQCNMIQLEKDIDQLDERIRQSADIDTVRSLKRWETLMERACVVDSLESQLVAKLTQLQHLLKEYYDILTLRAQIARLHRPSDRLVDAYRYFLKGSGIKDLNGSPMDLLSGRAKDFLSGASGPSNLPDQSDLVALEKPPDYDFLSRTLRDYWFSKKKPSDERPDDTLLYEDKNIVRFVAVLSMLLAATLLVGAVVSLYFVENEKVKLALIAIYTALFAASVKSCTDAKRAEVFAATAAYAAVLVVFVSGDLGGSNGGQCMVQLEGGIWKTVGCPG